MDKASRILKDMKYARIIDLIAEKQNISLEDAMDMLYSSTLFEVIDDGSADLICRSDLYLAGEIIRMHNPMGNKVIGGLPKTDRPISK